jgi:hypothetical protein
VAWSFGLQYAPALAAAGLMIALAVGLLVIDHRKASHQAFALFLFFRASSSLVAILPNVVGDLQWAGYFHRVLPYLVIPVVPSLLYFASVYPRRRGPLAASRYGWWVLAGVVAVGEVAYIVNHDWWATLSTAPATNPYLEAGGGYSYSDIGPLFLFTILQFPAIAGLALLFALDYVRAPPGSPRYSGFLVFIGLAVFALFDGTIKTVGSIQLLMDPAGYPMWPWGWTWALLPLLTLPVILLAVGLLIRHAVKSPDPTDNMQIKRFLVVAPIPLVTAILLPFVGTNSVYLGGELAPYIFGLWRLALPALVTYALLRYDLFNLDIAVKRSIRYGTVAAAFVIVFYVASETAEDYLKGFLGEYGGFIAAGALAFAIKPLENLGERLASKTMPHTKPLAALGHDDRLLLYQEQVALALQDKEMTERERQMLNRLRDRLGLTKKQAETVERRFSSSERDKVLARTPHPTL